LEEESKEVNEEPIPFWQAVIDDTSMLVVIGLVVPTLIYTIWGIMELIQTPIFTR
jgi:hypothetical protein